MQRVAGDATVHASVRRLLRIAARVCGGSYASATLGDGPNAVVIAHGDEPTDPAPSWQAPLCRTDGTSVGVLRILGLDGKLVPAELDAAVADVAALLVEQLEMRRTAELVAESTATLRASEEKLRVLLERAPDAFLVRRRERIVYCNQALLELYGYERDDELLGRSVLELAHPDLREELRARIATDEELPVTRRESRGVRRDGGVVALEASTVRIDYDGEPAMLAILRDISERKRLEQQLLVTERMASVGTLAAGVAHEINNPLAFVLTNVDYARAQLADGEAKTALEEALRGAERVQRIVQSLKTLSSADDDRRGPVNVLHAIELALSMAMNEIRLRAKLHRELADVPLVEANEPRLSQVFLNLVVNAVHAIPAGAPADHAITVSSGVDALGRVFVQVKDTGAGIPPDILPRIFDPFFTTKPLGLGTGLGLAICHGIVTSLGGSIAVESELGRGTSFRVILPARKGAPPVVAPPSEPPPSKGLRRGRVLVIDDEPMIVSSIRRVLAADHDITGTTSGAEALQLIDGGARYDVIICDLMMPEMTGMEVYAALRERVLEQAERMMFLTGGTFTEQARAFVEQLPTRVHHKPLAPAQLRDLVARMLSR
jgi:two-component system cell cycle sensor histidine kinase/response regulator CckA